MSSPKPQTEIAFIPLKPGVDVSSGEHRQVLLGALGVIRRQEGCKAVYWGVPIEREGEVEVIIEWQDISHGPTFASSPSFSSMLESLSIIISGGPCIIHSDSIVSFEALEAGVTERASAYFDASQDEEVYLKENWDVTVRAAEEHPEAGVKGMSGSWSQKLHPHACLGAGAEGKIFSAFVGWESVEAHMAFRKTELFGEIIGTMRGEQRGGEMWHTAFERVD